jgi:ferrous iron transport protein A
MASISLRALTPGQRATISAVTADGELGRRIRDMGLVPGAEITITGRAPLKDPVALKVGTTLLTLRNNEADQIMVAVPR